MTRWRRSAALLVALVVAVTVAVVPATPAGASIATDRSVYGRNEAVVIEFGQITYTSPCAKGIRDWLYPVADIYVLKGSTPPAGALSDVSGTPNTVIGVTGGGIFGEVIGYTKPAGSLGPGTYSVVIDECQDGQFNAAEDTFVPEAFRVVSRVVGPQLPDIGAIKADATVQAVRYERSVLAWKALLALSGKGGGAAGKAYGYFKKILFGVGFPDPAAIATIALASKGKHYRGIAADPPDPDFDQATVLAPTVTDGVRDPSDPLLALGDGAAPDLTTSAALTEGLLRALERYQGARAAQDGEWQLAHARGIRDQATLLADQLARDAVALDALADGLEALPTDYDTEAADTVATIDAFLASGPTPAEAADLANQGIAESSLRGVLTSLRAELDGLVVADLVADLRAIADDIPSEAAHLDALAADMEPIVDALVADPFVEGTVPVVDPGGPYTGTAGTPIAFDASGSAGAEPLAYAWDLDGDGDFDDATGATPSVALPVARTGLAGVRVTAGNGDVGVGYAPLVVTGGPAGPELSDRTPAARDVTVAAGATETFSVTLGGDAPTAVWYLDGVEVGTGDAFGYTPAQDDAGPHLLELVATDASGQRRGATWYVSVTAPDGDADLYWAHVDCDDTVATTYPGAPEPLDGVDNDCDPTTPDGGVAPTVPEVTPLAGPEGTTLEVVRSFTHPSGTYTATVDWGDGTVTPGTITSKTVRASHAYADDGVYTVEVCVTATLGKTGCNTGTATISNVAAGPRFSTLGAWTDEGYESNSSNWVVAPDELSVLQTINGNPTFFVSDVPVTSGVEAGVNLAVETTGDDDFVGFAIGVEPGFTTDPSADYLLLDWKQNTQSFFGCGGFGSTALRGLSLSRVSGIPHQNELWIHRDCPEHADGGVTELARATNLGDTGWGDNTQYELRIRATEDRIQIWVDDVLEFDLTGDFPGGHLAFYNFSQERVRYSGYQLVPGDVVEGTPRTYEVDFVDPGTADTHTGLVDWGDGSPLDALVISETNGEGTGSKSHTFTEDGTYDGEVCVTDDDGATGCQQFPIDVANAAPAVAAGRDRVRGPDVVLDDSVFEDPGILDTHTATVDWGDGGGPEPAAVDELLGEGIVTGGHTYVAEGIYDVEVCVTDDEGDTGCDAFSVDVRLGNGAPALETGPDAELVEGDTLAVPVGFTDVNPDDTHTATIDWDDGSPVEDVPLVSTGTLGTGGAVHQYVDDGTYAVAVEVCDDEPACDTGGLTAAVSNAPPVLEVSGGLADGGALRRTEVMEVTASFTDAGIVDTHTATVDWGDGEGPVTVPVTQDAGGGSLSTTHVYDDPAEYEAEVCVTDDDGGSDCETVTLVAPGALPGPPIDVSAIGGDGNARVRWDPPLDDGGSPLLLYEIEVTPGGATSTVAASDTTTIVGALDNDTDYTFRVRASNVYGWGPWSEPSNLTRPRPSCPGSVFLDVGADHPFCPEIKWMADNGVSNGFADGTYKPVRPVTRQAMAAFSYRLLNAGDGPPPACTSRPFPDVPVTDTFCAEIAWMKAEGITTGYADGTFRAEEPVSRQAMAAFLYRLTGAPRGDDPTCTQDEFADVPADHPFCGEIDWMVDIGVTGGFDDGTFRPPAPVARQAMAAFIFRYNILTGFIS